MSALTDIIIFIDAFPPSFCVFRTTRSAFNFAIDLELPHPSTTVALYREQSFLDLVFIKIILASITGPLNTR